MKANHIIVVPETHWDREWYLPFQEYRARLVLMMDKLLKILTEDPDYKNFTFDGQTIPIEDYLEVRPENEDLIRQFVQERRLSIGPMYILPDEFLISGESMIRNLIIGHKIAKKYGRVMKAGYIPDPFGHIAQLPQIISGFEIPSILFWRGFGDEFEENNLNVEFQWNAPGNAASALGIFLASGYGSIANLNPKKFSDGTYKSAHRTIRNVIKRFEKVTATPIVVLNSGSDHHEAKPQIPAIIKQWNEKNPDKLIEQNDFEYYVEKVLESKPDLKSFIGELRGGKYAHLLSGVFSARMWIKQHNTKIEYLYEKYAEPLSTMTWVLDTYEKFEYPQAYLLTGLKWLIKNHPHDSICGCSIDQVHNEMRTRFDWAEQIATEIFKSSIIYLDDLIKSETKGGDRFTLIVYNPLAWSRTDIVEFNLVAQGIKSEKFPEEIKIIDAYGTEIPYQHYWVEEEPRYTYEQNMSHRFSILAEVPACGYKIFYIVPGESPKEGTLEDKDFKVTKDYIENEFYKVNISSSGLIDVLDKESGKTYEKVCFLEDVGDWGDEYDYSGPREDQTDLKYSTGDAAVFERSVLLDGPTQKIYKLRLNLKLPQSLSEDRYAREDYLVDNKITMYISLYKGIKRVDFKIELNNQSKDHRIRVLFPSYIKSEKVHADGHFYVVPRDVNIPKVEKWAQKPLPTNNQKDFVAIGDGSDCVGVINRGLPEYEAIENQDGTITFAITLLRCIEWLSRGDFATRMSNAGPELKTPGSQEIGEHTFELSYVIENGKSNWLDAEIHVKGKEINNPLMPIFPFMTQTPLRFQDKLILTPLGILSYFMGGEKKEIDSYLPTELSFLEINNKKIMLSILKKSEVGNFLVIRVFNISSESQHGTVKLYEGLKIKKVEIVNLLEEKPINEIKAISKLKEGNKIEIDLDPHVIATLKIEFERPLKSS